MPSSLRPPSLSTIVFALLFLASAHLLAIVDREAWFNTHVEKLRKHIVVECFNTGDFNYWMKKAYDIPEGLKPKHVRADILNDDAKRASAEEELAKLANDYKMGTPPREWQEGWSHKNSKNLSLEE